MAPRIEILSEKKLIGKRIKTSLGNNKTSELWQSFMPRRTEIQNTISSDLFAIQIYDATYFEAFNPNTVFEKWATLEVTDFYKIPAEMESFTLSGGLYAVFEHKGHSTAIFDFIFTNWIPNSKYDLDHRPHFEILGVKYKNETPTQKKKYGFQLKKNCKN